jgi:adenosylmethionine-8-amino-7-oxononanoate aminotransferase
VVASAVMWVAAPRSVWIVGGFVMNGGKIYKERCGAIIKDADGKEHIDGLAGLWNVNVGLRTLESLPHVGNVRGQGLMCGVELVADTATRAYFPAEMGLSSKLMEALPERGLYTRAVMDSNCPVPPLMIGDDLIDRIVETLRVTIPEVLASVKQPA